MNPLIWIGGAKGVGKSTITDYLYRDYGLSVVNTGDIVKYARANSLNIEDAIVGFLNYNGVDVMDTHYVGYGVDGSMSRGLSGDRLLSIDRDIRLFLIDLDYTTLYNRRYNDGVNNRIMNLESITKELLMSRKLFKEYECDLGIKGTIIMNYDSESSAKKIMEEIKNGRQT